MAFTAVYDPPQRWTHMSLFYSSGADGKISETHSPTTLFKLSEFRVHFSVAFASVEYFTLKHTSIQGAAYNMTLYSANPSGSTDIFVHYSDPLLFLSGDTLTAELSTVSGTNVIGINLIGWAVLG
jgi:hypothetical protein